MKLLMYGVNRDTILSQNLEYDNEQGGLLNPDLENIKQMNGVEEVIFLDTPFRSEFYFYVDETIFQHGDLLRYFSSLTDKDLTSVIVETYSKFNDDVISHLCNYLLGFTVDIENVHERLDYIESAVAKRVTKSSNSTILVDLFNEVVHLGLRLQTNKHFSPIDESNFMQLMDIITDQAESHKNLNFVIVGNHSNSHYIAKLLAFYGAHSTIIGSEEDGYKPILFEKLQKLRELKYMNGLFEKIELTTLESSGDQVSKADVILLFNNEWTSHTIEDFNSRVHTSDILLEECSVIEVGDCGNKEINIINRENNQKVTKKMKNYYTNQEKLNAQGFVDSLIEDVTKKFIQSYTITNEY